VIEQLITQVLLLFFHFPPRFPFSRVAKPENLYHSFRLREAEKRLPSPNMILGFGSEHFIPLKIQLMGALKKRVFPTDPLSRTDNFGACIYIF